MINIAEENRKLYFVLLIIFKHTIGLNILKTSNFLDGQTGGK